jgi:hypothetical protein
MLRKSANMQVKTPQSKPGQAKRSEAKDKKLGEKETKRKSETPVRREERRTIQLARSVVRALDPLPLGLVWTW